MIYVDTGVLLGRYLARDPHHDAGLAGFARLRGQGAVTSSHVLDETLTLLARWAGGPFAAARGRELLASRGLRIERPGLRDTLLALDDLERFADQGVSYTDCVSFALMRRLRIQDAFAFDRRFTLAGFRLWPASCRPAAGGTGKPRVAGVVRFPECVVRPPRDPFSGIRIAMRVRRAPSFHVLA